MASTVNAVSPPPSGGRAPSESLALLYQNLFTGIVRVQAGRQRIAESETFRRRMKSVLDEVERNAVTLKYDFEDIRDTHLAVVAFLDEVVLASNDACRGEWARLPMAQALYGQPNAGDVFFDRLEETQRSRKDTQQLADVLEVYLLCMLLGFEGRYSGGSKAEIRRIVDQTRTRIDHIRQRSRRLSPDAALQDAAATPVILPGPKNRFQLRAIAIGAAIGVVVLFVILKLHLYWSSGQIQQAIMKHR